MADNSLDAVLQGQDTASASQAQTDQPGVSETQVEEKQPEKPEEVEFNNLAGSTQDRIKKLVGDKRELLERVEKLETVNRSVPPPPPTDQGVKDAVNKLDEVGIATKDFVQRTTEDTLARLRYETEMDRLTSKFTGDKGEPQFVREEYEEFVSDHPQYRSYLPEDVFKVKMFSDEFRSLDTAETGTSKIRTLKPTRTQTMKESLTPESIEEHLKGLPTAERNKWYSDHVDEINAVLGKMG